MGIIVSIVVVITTSLSRVFAFPSSSFSWDPGTTQVYLQERLQRQKQKPWNRVMMERGDGPADAKVVLPEHLEADMSGHGLHRVQTFHYDVYEMYGYLKPPQYI